MINFASNDQARKQKHQLSKESDDPKVARLPKRSLLAATKSQRPQEGPRFRSDRVDCGHLLVCAGRRGKRQRSQQESAELFDV
jgi:hypothetical protein